MAVILRIFHECEVRIEKSARGSLFWHHEAPIDSFSCIPFRSPAFDFNVRVVMNKSCCFMLMSAILKADVVCDVTMTSTATS